MLMTILSRLRPAVLLFTVGALCPAWGGFCLFPSPARAGMVYTTEAFRVDSSAKTEDIYHMSAGGWPNDPLLAITGANIVGTSGAQTVMGIQAYGMDLNMTTPITYTYGMYPSEGGMFDSASVGPVLYLNGRPNYTAIQRPEFLPGVNGLAVGTYTGEDWLMSTPFTHDQTSWNVGGYNGVAGAVGDNGQTAYLALSWNVSVLTTTPGESVNTEIDVYETHDFQQMTKTAQITGASAGNALALGVAPAGRDWACVYEDAEGKIQMHQSISGRQSSHLLQDLPQPGPSAGTGNLLAANVNYPNFAYVCNAGDTKQVVVGAITPGGCTTATMPGTLSGESQWDIGVSTAPGGVITPGADLLVSYYYSYYDREQGMGSRSSTYMIPDMSRPMPWPILFMDPNGLPSPIMDAAKIAYTAYQNGQVGAWFDVPGNSIYYTKLGRPAEPLKGDIDGNGVVNLSDLMTGLRILAGMPVPDGLTVNWKADVNKDGKIGMAEVIYIAGTVIRQ